MRERLSCQTDRTLSRITLVGALGLVALVLGGCAAGQPGSGVAVQETAPGRPTPPAAIAGGPSIRDLMSALTRSGVGPDQVAIELTYAPSLFFEVTGLQPPTEAGARPTLAFMLQETVHDGALPNEPPAVLLVLDAGARAEPYDVKVTAIDPHHRTTRLLFSDPGGASTGTLAGSVHGLTLVVPFADGTVSAGNTFVWQLPIELEASATHTSLGASR